MASITTRAGKGSPLTNAELDANFTNLNSELGGKLVAANNLSDVTSQSSARTNIGLGAVENKSSATIRGEITSGDVTTALGFTPENAAGKGAANGYAPLDSSAKIASTYLPSYVDDVLEYANLASFPGTGETGKIYVALDTNKTYRWSGSAYVEISPSPGTTDSLTEGSTNLYFTNARARGAISVTQNLTYDGSTGVITGPDLSGYLLAATASSTYQTQAGMSSYLTTASAASTYQTQSGMSSYLTTAAAASGYAALSGATFTGNVAMTDSILSRSMLKDTAIVYFNSGTTNALDYTNGSHQRWAPSTGSQTLSVTNWPPSGNLGQILIEGVNLGASTITWPTINWLKPDGTTTTSIATYLTSINSRTLQSSGTDWVLLWTRDAGTTLYGKLL